MVRDVDIFKRLWKDRVAERRSKSDWASTEAFSPRVGNSIVKKLTRRYLHLAPSAIDE